MKKFLCLFLIVSFVFSICFADSYTEGAMDGEAAAKNASTAKWKTIGFFSGCCLNGVGCLGATLVGYLMSPQIPMRAMGKGSEYMMGYKSSYVSSVKKKQATSAFIGGILGNLAFIVAYGIFYLVYVVILGLSFATN